jgi:hypothetical protein
MSASRRGAAGERQGLQSWRSRPCCPSDTEKHRSLSSIGYGSSYELEQLDS